MRRKLLLQTIWFIAIPLVLGAFWDIMFQVFTPDGPTTKQVVESWIWTFIVSVTLTLIVTRRIWK